MLIKFKDITPVIDKDTKIFEGAKVIGNVSLHKDVSIWFNAVLRADLCKIEIDEGTNIQDNSTVHGDTNKDVYIGKHCVVGHNAVIHGAKIGNNTLIGMNSTVLDSAVIGNNCIVAANSLVMSGMVIPDNSLVAGSPAVIKKTNLKSKITDEIKKGAFQYIDLIEDY